MSKLSFFSQIVSVRGARHVTALVLTAALSSAAMAGGGGDHAHAPAKSNQGMMSQGHLDGDGAHAHDQWVEPPERYTSFNNSSWEDPEAVRRGHDLFEANCSVCHGIDGRGTGPVSDNLDHKPADLTSHFHRGPGLGDAYLFWRVSEGGTVEPFKSQGSAMPAFKSSLSEQERWDVLTYVHQLFHRSFNGPHDEDNGMGPQAAH